MDIIMFIDLKNSMLINFKEEISKLNNSQELKEFSKNKFWVDLSDEEANALYDYFRSNDENAIIEYVMTKILQMTDKDKAEKIMDLFMRMKNEGIRTLIENSIDSIEDKGILLDIYFERAWRTAEWNERTNLILSKVSDRYLIDYIKSKNNVELMRAIIENGRIVDILEQMEESERTIFIIESLIGTFRSIRIEDSVVEQVLYGIKNEYYREVLIIYAYGNYGISVDTCKGAILECKNLSEQLEQITDEKEKTDFIANLYDNDMKLEFLKQIKSRENRDKIIQSLKNEIDPSIQPQVELVQKMIREFFQDKLENGLTEMQREKLETVIAKTSVGFENLKEPTNGRSYNFESRISISNRHINNLNKTIKCLIHEYGHVFSLQNIRTENYKRNDNIEEGMQDLFSELVINHYIEKHGLIEMQGKKVRMEYPCKSYSCYDTENSWTRTMIYPLQSQGKDIEAVTEYLLGDKNKFLELTLGKENADSKPRDLFGNADINVWWEELYNQMPEGFENSDATTSIYCRRNNFIPIFKLQQKLGEKGVNFFELEGNSKYLCKYIAEKYFDGRRIYQISREEMAEFYDLYDAQNGNVITGYDDYANESINKLSEDEIKDYSTEILDTSLAIWRKLNNIGPNLENVLGLALKEERDRVEQGQNISETASKYRRLINDYMTLLSRVNSDASEYLQDAVQDLKAEYLQQMEESIKSGDLQGLLEGLRNTDDGTIYADTDILELFESLGVKFEEIQLMRTSYKSQDIVGAAIRGKLRVDDIKRVSVEIKKDSKTDELEEEVEKD